MSDRIRVGIWGLGRAGLNMHAPEVRLFPEMYELVAGMDTAPDRCELFEKNYGCRSYDTESALLEDPDLDLISIATRSLDHVNHCARALETGRYVFLEKPIATSYAEGLRLIELDRKYPGKLFLRHNRRFEAPFNHIREIIATGMLGEVYEIKLCRHSYKRRNDWQTLIECGGGQLNNWGPHIIDHALQFLDYRVKEVWSDLKRIAAVGNAEDHLKIVIKGETGRVVDLEISGGVALSQPEFTVFGTRGALVCNGNTMKVRRIDPDQVFQNEEAFAGNPPLDGGVASGYADLEAIRWIEEDFEARPSVPTDMPSIWQAMYCSIREDSAFPVTIDQALAVLKVSEEVKRGTEFLACEEGSASNMVGAKYDWQFSKAGDGSPRPLTMNERN